MNETAMFLEQGNNASQHYYDHHDRVPLTRTVSDDFYLGKTATLMKCFSKITCQNDVDLIACISTSLDRLMQRGKLQAWNLILCIVQYNYPSKCPPLQENLRYPIMDGGGNLCYRSRNIIWVCASLLVLQLAKPNVFFAGVATKRNVEKDHKNPPVVRRKTSFKAELVP